MPKIRKSRCSSNKWDAKRECRTSCFMPSAMSMKIKSIKSEKSKKSPLTPSSKECRSISDPLATMATRPSYYATMGAANSLRLSLGKYSLL